MIINNIGINFAGGGGGSKAVLESKNYTITQNGDTTIQPSEGVDGISGGTISVNVQPSVTSITITTNGTYTPSSGVDGYSSVSVNVPQVNENKIPGWIYPYGSTTALTEDDFAEFPITTGSLGQYNLYFQESVKSIRFPYWIRRVNNYACGRLTSLESINLDRITELGSSALAYDEHLYDFGSMLNIKKFGGSCFERCDLRGNIELMPESVTGMAQSSIFNYNSNLTGITFLDNVGAIKPSGWGGPFIGNQRLTGLTMIDFTHNVQVPPMTDSDMTNFTKLAPNYEIRVPQILYDEWIVAPGWRTITDHIVAYPNPWGNNTFKYTTSDGQPLSSSALTSTTMWNGIYVSDSYDATTGGSLTMYGLTRFPMLSNEDKKRLTSIEMPDSILYAQSYALCGCTSLDTIVMSQGLRFADYAFINGPKITELMFGPDFVGNLYLKDVSNLRKIALKSAYPPHTGFLDTAGVPRDGTLYVPMQSVAIYRDWLDRIKAGNSGENLTYWTVVGVSDWTNWDFPS